MIDSYHKNQRLFTMEPCQVKRELLEPKYFEGEVVNNDYDKISTPENIKKEATCIKLENVNETVISSRMSDQSADSCDIDETFNCVKHEYELLDINEVKKENPIDTNPTKLENVNETVISSRMSDQSADYCDIYETFNCVKHEYELLDGNEVKKENQIDINLTSTIQINDTQQLEPDLEHSKAKDFNTNFVSMFNHYCLACKEIKNMSTVTWRKTNCPKCGTSMVFQCKMCGKLYHHRSSMHGHLQLHKNRDQFNCSQCDFKASRASSLRRHTVCVHAEESARLECSKCSKTLKNIKGWKDHVTFCGKEPRLSCERCPYKAHRQRNFNKHMRSHEIVCSQIMNENREKQIKSDGKKSIVVNTIVKAKSDGNYQVILPTPKKNVLLYFNRFCSQCNRNFENCVLRNPSYCKICNTKLLMQCLECNIKHKDIHAIRRHLLRRCTLRTLFQCSKCNYKTPDKFSLGTHVKRVHSSVDS